MLTNYSLFHGKPTVDYCFSIFSDAQFIILLLGLVAVAFPYTYHGCAMAPNSEHGWVVTSDTVLVLHTWDGGANWEEQHLPLPFHYYFFDVFFLDTLKGWTANRLAMIWHTSDGGLTWHFQTLGMADFATRIFFLNSLFVGLLVGQQ